MRTARHLAFSAALLAACGCTEGPIGVATLPSGNLFISLLAHWTFDEGMLTTVHDRSGNGRDGQIFGSNWSWVTDGRFAGAFHFGGPDPFAGGGDQVTVGGFPQATPSFSVSAWYRLSSADVTSDLSTVGPLLSNELTGGGWAVNLVLPPPPGNGDANYHFSYWVGPSPGDFELASCRCLVENVWTHLAAVLDGPEGTLSFYVNGTLRSQVHVDQPILRGLPTLYIGRWQVPVATRFLTGDMDDVAIWSRALAAEEVMMLFAAPAPVVP